MTPNELFQACMQMVEATTQWRKNRQDYEWKFTISFWTLIVGGIAASHTILIFCNRWWRIGLSITGLTIYSFLWLRGVHDSHRRDRRIGQVYFNSAQAL